MPTKTQNRKKITDAQKVSFQLGNKFVEKAHDFLQQNAYQQAQDLLEKALAINNNSELGHLYLGIAYLNLHNEEKAEAEFRTVLRLNPASPQAHYHLGGLYFINCLYDKAIKEYRQATELDSEFKEAYHFMGLALDMLGQVRDAEQAFQQAQHAKRKALL